MDNLEIIKMKKEMEQKIENMNNNEPSIKERVDTLYTLRYMDTYTINKLMDIFDGHIKDDSSLKLHADALKVYNVCSYLLIINVILTIFCVGAYGVMQNKVTELEKKIEIMQTVNQKGIENGK